MAIDILNISEDLSRYTNWAKKNAGSARDILGIKVGKGFGEDEFVSLKKVAAGQAQDLARTTAVAGFKTALTETIGKTLANQAWEAVGGAASKGLSAGLIKKVVAEANRLVNQFNPGGVMGKLYNLKPAVVSEIVLGEFGTVYHAEFQVSCSVTKANCLLGKTPASQAEVTALKNQITTAIQDLNKCLQESSVLSIRREIGKIIGELQEKSKQADEAFTNLPGRETLTKLAGGWHDSVLAACDELMSSVKDKDKQTSTDLSQKLNEFKGKWGEAEIAGRLDSNKSSFFNKGFLRKKLFGSHYKLDYQLGKELEKIYKSVTGSSKLPNGTSMKDLLAGCHSDLLNKGTWASLEKKFTGTLNGQTFAMQSNITPGRRIDDSIGAQYGDENIMSFNCHCKNTANAVNLATTELSVGGNTVFRGVRHGVHSAKDVPNLTKEQANTKRATQTVTAAFVEYLKMHPNPETKENGVIEFNMTSISLLTPSFATEKGKFLAQRAAWNSVHDHEFTVTVGGRDYTVKPHITMFNYGVNKGAVNLKGEPITGWGNVSGMNSDSLDALMRRAETFIGNCPDEKTRKAVETLKGQIDDIARNKSERKDKNEAYKIVSRLAVISYLMGDVPVWNCKSGKDRTGMMDVECKFLATLIDRGVEIPEPGAKLNDEQKDLFNTIARQSGNLEMQEYNTGAAGYKLKGVDSIYARVGASGDEEAKKTFQGGSGYVGS